MIYLIYAIIAAVVVLCSIKCANYVDLIDKKTNLSGAFIGGVILAAVTSLPELITSISAITLFKEPGLVMGNVLGSNIFNLAVLGALILFTAKSFAKTNVSKSHTITLVSTLIVFVLVAITVIAKFEVEIFGISAVSILILLIYIFTIKHMAGDEGESDSEDDSPLTLKQVIFRFIIMSILLVIASMLITYITDIINKELNLGSSLAGALFLGVATSLPELSSSVALVRKKNYNAMIGNIVGSNMFNFAILLFSDVLYYQGSIYAKTANEQTNLLIIFGTIASVFAGGLLLFKRKEKLNKTLVLGITAGLILVSYIAYLFASM